MGKMCLFFGIPKAGDIFVAFLQLVPYHFIMSEDLASKIRKQVEFYFSGLNLRRDKFMREKMSADPEGCIVYETYFTGSYDH